MHTNPSDAARFRVGDLEVETGLQRVVRNGVEVPLPKLSYDLFLTLVRAAPNLVSHQELLAHVWPGLVVTDKTVSQRVKLLRDALGDDPETPRYVAGLRGRGYRIVAPVVASSHADPDERPTVTMQTHWALRRVPALIGGLVLAVAIGAAFWSWIAMRTTSSRATPVERTPVLAVLPFSEPGSGTDPFVGVGIAEAIAERLSKARGLSTIAPDSSFRLDSARPSAELAQRVGADYLLGGDVERSGDMLRISARLVSAATDGEVWAADFDRRLSEILDVEEDIARQAAAALLGRGDSAQALPATSRATVNVDAYLSYLRGRALLARWTVVAARQAEAEFADAIGRDPAFSSAYASLYEARLLAADRAAGGASPNAANGFLGESPLAAARAQNQYLIDRAIALDHESGAAYFARAIWAADDSVARERDFLRGLELDPSNGRGITAYSEYLDRTGRPAEAERMLDRALSIDPISPRAHFVRVMRMFPIEPAELTASMKAVLEIDPNYQPALQRYAKYCWMFNGDLATGITTIERALALDPGNPWLTHTAVAMYLDIGDEHTARRLVAAAEHPEISGDLLLALYDRDVDKAGAAAFEDAAFASGRYENWGAYEALRDWALESGNLQRALDSLQSRTGFSERHRVVRRGNFRAVPAVAQLLLALGRSEEARRLLTETIQWIDDYHLPNFSTIYALRVKASALLLLGEQDLALDALDASFRGNDYLQWWYTLERDPLWSRVRDDRRFRAIAGRVHEHIDQQRSALAALRERELVPSSASASN